MAQESDAGERRRQLVRSVLDGLHRAGWNGIVADIVVQVEGISIPLAYFEQDFQATIDKIGALLGSVLPNDQLRFQPHYPLAYERPARYRVELDLTERSG